MAQESSPFQDAEEIGSVRHASGIVKSWPGPAQTPIVQSYAHLFRSKSHYANGLTPGKVYIALYPASSVPLGTHGPVEISASFEALQASPAALLLPRSALPPSHLPAGLSGSMVQKWSIASHAQDHAQNTDSAIRFGQ